MKELPTLFSFEKFQDLFAVEKSSKYGKSYSNDANDSCHPPMIRSRKFKLQFLFGSLRVAIFVWLRFGLPSLNEVLSLNFVLGRIWISRVKCLGADLRGCIFVVVRRGILVSLLAPLRPTP